MFTERDLSFFSSNKYAFGVIHGKENVLKKKEQMSKKIIFQKAETAYETRRHCSFASLNLKASEVVRKCAKCFFLSYHSRFFSQESFQAWLPIFQSETEGIVIWKKAAIHSQVRNPRYAWLAHFAERTILK